MLASYRATLHDINSHQHDVMALRGQLEALSEQSEKLDQQLQEIVDLYGKVQGHASKLILSTSTPLINKIFPSESG